MPENGVGGGIERLGTTGEAVVLIHGFTGHPGHCLPMADYLSERGHTVAAPRLAGHGTTPVDLAATTADDWLASAREAAESVADHRRVHLVGLSLGGLIGILLARPTAAATITTINSPILTRDRKVALAPVARYWVDSTPAADAPCPDPDLADLWLPYPVIPTAAVAELVGVIGRAYLAAGRLRRPSLVIQSRTDEAVRPRSGPILARRLQGRLMWLERSRHNALLDPARHLIHEAVAAHISP
jgi:carboxylesterase